MKRFFAAVQAAALCALCFCASSCGKKTIACAAEKRGVDFGFAASVTDLLSEDTQKLLTSEAKILVAENCMKSSQLRPNKTFWNWSDPESLVKFAEKNKIVAKWHTLFWHEMNPPFINSLKTKEDAEAMMDEHITTVMQKFKGRIRDYDVVNEMFNEDGSLRDTVWLRTLGPGYLERALRKAHEVDPAAHLFLNEYNNEAAGYAKADAMYNMVKDFVERGVPIYGVGMQLHLAADLPYDEDAIRANIRRYAELGIKICFSEVDVRIPLSRLEELEPKQKQIWKSLMKLAVEEPNVESFIVWGVSDKNSWIPAWKPGYGNALLFDKNFKPKPIYFEMLEVAANKKK